MKNFGPHVKRIFSIAVWYLNCLEHKNKTVRFFRFLSLFKKTDLGTKIMSKSNMWPVADPSYRKKQSIYR